MSCTCLLYLTCLISPLDAIAQIFLWVALQIRRDDDFMGSDDCSHSDRMSGGLEKYIELAEGDNGGIMMTFVQRVIAKMENVDEQYLVL